MSWFFLDNDGQNSFIQSESCRKYRENKMKFNRSTIPLVALALSTSGVAVAQGHGPYQPLGGSYVLYAQEYDHHDHDDWDKPPQEFREIQRQGFHDGVEGARKDFDNHRRPDVNNRDEYRHPNVPRSGRDDYREGFRRGYDVAMSHMLGGPGPRG
jgi:hypothetical protein